MATVIQWKSLRNHTCVLTIEDGRNDVLNVTPSATPFTVQGSADEDFFKPVRTQSGNIGIVAELGIIDRILGDAPLSRPVTLRTDGTVTWIGYLEQTTYTQPWDCQEQEFTIPVVSPIEVADHIDLNYDNRKYQSFAEFLMELNTRLGNRWTDFNFPECSNVKTTLQYKFSRANYIKWDDGDCKWNCESYQKVLTDICILFGWQLQEDATSLFFSSHDIEDRFEQIDAQELEDIAQGNNVMTGGYASHTYTVSDCANMIGGAEHTIDYIPGKKSVKAVGKINKFDLTLFSLDLRNRTKTGYNVRSKLKNNQLLVFAEKSYASDSVLQVTHDYDLKYAIFAGSDGAIPTGSYIAKESLYNDGDASATLSYRSLIVVSQTGAAIHIYPRFQYERTALTINQYLAISGTLSKAVNGSDNWDDTAHFVMKAKIVVGRQYYTDTLPYDGGTDSNYGWSQSDSEVGLGSQSCIFPRNDRHIFPSSARSARLCISMPSDPGDGNIHIRLRPAENIAIAIENLKINFVYPWPVIEDEDMTEKNETSYDISNGFKEEYVLESNLTTRKDAYQYGTGIILSPVLTDTPPEILYGSERPEVALANRLRSYYSKSRKKITVMLQNNGQALYLEDHYSLDETKEYIIIAKSIDYGSDTATVTFLEI